MSGSSRAVLLLAALASATVPGAIALTGPPATASLDSRFSKQVRPFLEQYCWSCHGSAKHKGGLDLSRDVTAADVAKRDRQWGRVLDRLRAGEMPPEDAPRQPPAAERAVVAAWLTDFRAAELARTAGDPGIVLARRLSNAEFDNTIRDLTGVDMRPARTFPVDPANQAGFDNSGESLTMSPALLKKYLAAARLVADQLVLTPDGFAFAPFPVVAVTDRDHYCVQRILDFYQRHRVDLADYFLAAWKYRHRDQLGRPGANRDRYATEAGLSAKYLALIWSALADDEAAGGPLAEVRKAWNELPAKLNDVRAGCERLRDLVLRLRRPLQPTIGKLHVRGISDGSQPLLLWRDRQFAGKHRGYSGDAVADPRPRSSLERFCAVFPDAFVVSDRGPYFDPKAAGKGRPLTAGFHLMQGYFRDDAPLYELILNDRERKELDALWFELDFITGAPLRQYRDFIFFERAEPPRFLYDAEFDFARSEDKDCTATAKMARLAEAYLAKARRHQASAEAQAAIREYFTRIAADIRRVEQARLAAEPRQFDALVKFAEQAYRRPLTNAEQDDLRKFYRTLRQQEKLSHEEALHDALVSVLMSPHFCYRLDLAIPGSAARPLSDYELASRLSYFLWASMPDAELLAHAAAGDLHRPDVLTAQARRMLHDPKVRGLATECVGNWLDFRRFEEHNGVDRARFPSFTNELRQAMFEEPIHYFMDVMQRDRSVLDLLYGTDTFVNRVLARHYGMPEPPTNVWAHVEDARRYGRGGLLPMAVFLTKNAPGLRTSPVKRGYWVVQRLLGERIPPPPPTVPQLPKDEAHLGELSLPRLLARHRADKSCSGCHDRFDSVGLAFEGFGPVGERRATDLGGKPVESVATYPDGRSRNGIDGLRAYLREKRQGDFVDNLCRKLLAYALGRSLQLSDEPLLAAMRAKLSAHGLAFGGLVEAIVTSRQFLSKRGSEGPQPPGR